MLRLSERESRPTIVASAVLGLALLGDSLLYAALPLHAAAFGISLAWAGVLLSANRIVRIAAYPLLARAADASGLRRFTIAAAIAGAGSTLAFAAWTGPGPLLAARLAWGLAFGALSLGSIAYATVNSEGAGARIGLSFSLREVGPLFALTAGALLVTSAGIRPALALMGTISLLAVPLAFRLPDPAIRRMERTRSLVSHHEFFSASIGLVADGLFPATIALMLAPSTGAGGAVLAAGAILGSKRVAAVVLSPIAGSAADRFGPSMTSAAGLAAAAGGALLIGIGSTATGSIILISGAAISATSIPLAASIDRAGNRVATLARLAMARDAGAAAGPLIAMLLFDVTGPAILYLAGGVILAFTALRSSPRAAAAHSRLPRPS